MFTYTLATLKDTQELAQELCVHLKPKTLMRVDGPLGSGKTTLIRFIADAMGMGKAASPTFSIHSRYQNKSQTLDHVDLYRVESEESLETTGFWELFQNEDSILIVEWAERIPETYWPKDWKQVALKFSKEKDQAARVSLSLK